ncbi:hypothetical protein DFA_01524 [Cavenderia fasciculata]|uniref:Uncharacterized protein n=1 Tax=Cavenderia fasciculata TaxID=261658 RepID=F4PTB6_CACFS|nr:uncharacterized protein DFA_01524 [Cavenderia fasciculata]EGG21638.1 hypothetical protein DFA_01524 [Cavenderia fasciculata]|eukprot:XP_004359488.1 hypothetical protein DFA_01524 [Cavenderia fasciculata]
MTSYSCWVEFGSYKTHLTFGNPTNYDTLILTIRKSEQLDIPRGHSILLYKDKALTTLLDQELDVDFNLTRIYVSSPAQQQAILSNLEQLEKYLNDLGISSQYNEQDESSPFMDRDDAVDSVANTIEDMYSAFKSEDKTRENHPFITCITGSGMGKTTFGRECHRRLKNFNFSDNEISQAMKSSRYIFIDFNGGGDRLDESDLSRDPDSISVALEKRLFARAIMHKSFDVISKHLTQTNGLFSFGSTFRYLRKKLGISNEIPIAIFLHLDEFPMANAFVVENNHPSFVKIMIEGLGTYRCRGDSKSDANQDNIFLIPLLTGTTSNGTEPTMLSKWKMNCVNIFPISLDSSLSMIKSMCKKPPLRSKKESILEDRQFITFINDLGIIPRSLMTSNFQCAQISVGLHLKKSRPSFSCCVTTCIRTLHSQFNIFSHPQRVFKILSTWFQKRFTISLKINTSGLMDLPKAPIFRSKVK